MGRVIGLKLTHDAAVAVIEGGRLRCSVEVEKVNENARYSAMLNWEMVRGILSREGINGFAGARVAIDGWRGGHVRAPFDLRVAGYLDLAEEETVRGVLEEGIPYESRSHVLGHVMGTYRLSPFAHANEPAKVIVWDGGMPATLFDVKPSGFVSRVGVLVPFRGVLYGIMGYYFGPYKRERLLTMDKIVRDGPKEWLGGRETPGKLMAWIAKGSPSLMALDWMWDWLRAKGSSEFLYKDSFEQRPDALMEHRFMLDVHARWSGELSDADVLATIHEFMSSLLRASAHDCVRPGENLCFTGGSALNIKWNSALREDVAPSLWVPPFANDTGSAIGAAAAVPRRSGEAMGIDWSLYSGPRLTPSGTVSRWMSEKELGVYLHATGRPVVVLSGRSEIGPRALGARSILCAPVGDAKARLNLLKGREEWRPVAPICLEEEAQEIFEPGSRDEFMLFEHRVRKEWVERVPAIVHLDGTARLQTVPNYNRAEDASWTVRRVLLSYREASGIPLLCNTSANLPGRGFFPSVDAALRWGKADVWSDGVLYQLEGR